jgi:hypothetical protein
VQLQTRNKDPLCCRCLSHCGDSLASQLNAPS